MRQSTKVEHKVKHKYQNDFISVHASFKVIIFQIEFIWF